MRGKILVTGGAGYIGSHVVKLLGDGGFEVITVDNLSTGTRQSVLAGKLVQLDLGDNKALSDLLQETRPVAVMHFAGSIVVPESVADPVTYYRNNSQNSLELIALCLQHKVPNFIFSSTAAVYGMGEVGQSLSEQTPLSPINPYGRSKLMTEMMLEDVAGANPDFRYVALRYFNVAGAHPENILGQRSKNATHLIKICAEAAVGKRETVSIFGTDYATPDGTCLRDYIHVSDLAQAHLDAYTYLMQGGGSLALNCGYGRGTSVKEIIEKVKAFGDLDFEVMEEGRRAGDPPILVAKADLIKEALDWRPQYDDLDFIVKTAVDWERTLC